jgi:hypothetical protein
MGTAVGMAIGNWVSAFLFWWQFGVALREYKARTDGSVGRRGLTGRRAAA